VLSVIDILLGYEVRYKNYLQKDDIASAKKEMESLLKTIDEEGVMPWESRQVKKIVLNLFDSYISISDILNAARTFDYLIALKTDKEQMQPKAVVLIKSAYDKKTNIDKTLRSIRGIYKDDKEVLDTLSLTTKSQVASVKTEKIEARNIEKKEELKDKKVIDMALELANNYEKKNNFTLSLDIITDLLKTYPNNNDALKMKTRLEAKIRKLEPVEAKPVTKVESPAEHLNLIAEIIKNIESGELAKANEKSLEMITKNPKEPKYWLLRAIIAYKNKDLKAYQNFISYALRLDKNIMNDEIYKRYITT
jgi:hypothetical protein